ncbi:hypothetical protein D3C86_1655360 [compost metagenome]
MAHSSVRPPHGSPVTSASALRLRIDTTICSTWKPIPMAMNTTPITAAYRNGVQAGLSVWFRRRVMPIRPSTYSGMKAK